MTTSSPTARTPSLISTLARDLADVLGDRLNRLADDVENACALMIRSNLATATPAMVSALSETRREVGAAYERLRAELPEGSERGKAGAEMWLLRAQDERVMGDPSLLRIYWKPSTMRVWAGEWQRWAAEE